MWQPSNELLLALGLEDRITAFAGFYTEPLPEFQAAVTETPSLGASTQWPSREVMLTQGADLVVGEGLSGFAYDPSQGYATVAELEEVGAQVLSTGSSCDPLSPGDKAITTVYDDLRMLGAVFGVSERADALIANLQEKERAVAAAVTNRESRDVAFYNGGEDPLVVLSFGIWRDAVEHAGGQSVMPTEGFQVSREAFAAAQPEVILVGTFPGQDVEPLQDFLRKTFPTVPAVQADRLVEIPTILTEASVRIMDGYRLIAEAIHPEAFE